MNQPSPTPSNEGFQKTVSLDCVALAFKVRHMIFDKSVPLLYPNIKGGDLEVDIEDILAERKRKRLLPRSRLLLYERRKMTTILMTKMRVPKQTETTTRTSIRTVAV